MKKEMEQQWRAALSSNTKYSYDNNFFGDINTDGWMDIEDFKHRIISLPFIVIGYALFLDVFRFIIADGGEDYIPELVSTHPIVAKIFETAIDLPAVVFSEKFTSSHPILSLLAVLGVLNIAGACITAASAAQRRLVKFWCRIIPFIIICCVLMLIIITDPDAIAEDISTMVIFILIPYLIGCGIGKCI